ncbi:4'-phosphopantetheinyl transferase family protein [Kitasatospora camelliae]|uniref:4'-phosphopantetheinyl transferase superfamily protein n=1 Tax=Kitasatospora camelliae TaxID=3156397 RepID=A0AAU8K6J2_9ACTN
MIEAILPAGVAVREAFHDLPEAELLPDEAPYVARSVAPRRREFATARLCARQALAQLGLPSGRPLLKDRHGAPVWPPGVVGSITHCDGYRAAAVARASHLTLLGIDAEPAETLPDGVLESIALPAELARVRRLLDVYPGIPWDRLLFSAKEAVHKGWYPYAGQRLEPEDADLTLDPRGGFTARLLPRPPPGSRPVPYPLQGRWLVRAGLAVSAVAVPAGPWPGPPIV